MFEILTLSGPWGILLSGLFLLNLGLAGWCGVSLMRTEGTIDLRLRNRINSILFWGAFGAVVGLLGQANGLYLAARAISRAPDISPPIVMEGFATSLLTTIMGLLLLLGSGLAWIGLRALHTRRSQ